jgi:hypothetical protein
MAEKNQIAIGLDIVPRVANSGIGSLGVSVHGEYALSDLFSVKTSIEYHLSESSKTVYEGSDVIAGGSYYDDSSYYASSYALCTASLEGRVYPFNAAPKGWFAGLGYSLATATSSRNVTNLYHGPLGTLGYKWAFRPQRNVAFFIEPSTLLSFCVNAPEVRENGRDLTKELRIQGQSLQIIIGVLF